MQKIFSFSDTFQHNYKNRYIRRLLVGGYSSVIIVMVISMIVTFKFGTNLAKLGTEILGERYPYSIELLRLKQKINDAHRRANDYEIYGNKNYQDEYLKTFALSISASNTLLKQSLNKTYNKDFYSVSKNLNQLNILNKELFKSNTIESERITNLNAIKHLFIKLNADINLIINQNMESTHADSRLLNKRLNEIIDFNIGIMLAMLVIGFVIVFLVTKNITKLLNQLEESKKTSDDSKARAEQKTRELSRTSQVLVKTNKNLSNSLEKLNSTQDQLVQNEKMASLGGLVAGIAHEINTPIGIGVTASSHLEDNIKSFEVKFESGQIKKSEMSDFINTSKEASYILLQNLERAAKLIHSFKQVAVDQTSEEIRHFNLKEYLQGIILSLQPKIKKTKITIKLSCPDDIELNSYPGGYSQIFTNLIINSLIHGYHDNEHGQINIHITKNEEGIKIIYKDNGHGIDDDHLAQLFDPFFTTKRGQGGSGLGLHLVYNIVTQQLHGDIQVRNRSIKGTRFDIKIPNHEADPNLIC